MLATAGTVFIGAQPAVFAAGEKELAATGSTEAGSAAPASADVHWKMIDDTCGKCHNSQDWAGGLAFDILDRDVNGIGAEAETWEKTVRKLRGRLMPPPGEPQPDQRSIDAFVSWMEGELDKNAAANPDPGYVGLHRLNRTEYAREIERILGLQVDVKSLLPKDVSSEGFDNIAATLRISPSFVDQYITAARNVSRQAIGSVTQKPSSREYRVDGSNQDKHVDGLPLGTRGGFVIDHYFPADGEYEFNIRDFFFMGAGYVTKVDSRHTVIMTIDGARVFQQDAGGPEDLKDVDLRQAAAADEMQARFNKIRVKVKAGQHKIGVAFVQRSFAQSDSPLQPIAMLPEMERSPLIPGIDIAGPFNVTGLSDTESRRRVFICRPSNASEEPACAKRIFTNLATEAFRRPATDADLEAPLRFYETGRKAGHDFESGIESGLTAILSSTKFLFRSDPAGLNAQPGKATKLTDLEVASRLSFFLWSSGPDRELLDLATAGKLSDPKVLNEQVRRMLADPRAESLLTNFAYQWLNVGRIDNIQPDPVLYPNFGPDLREAFREEIRLFLGSVLRENRSVLDLIRSDTTFLNERLALHYGVPNVRGAQFRPVQLKDANRWGLFGKGAVLMGTSYGNRTSPVLRGAWVLENIAGTPPSSPPPGVEQFKENEPGKKASTVRERLEQHRANPSCNGCHGVIDPLGFALENYDVTGAWRAIDPDAREVIDARGQLASGVHVNGPADLSKSVLDRPDQFVQAFTEKLMTFALGRALNEHDMPTVRAIVREAAKDDYRFESILRGIASSQAFQMRQVPTQSQTPENKHAMVTQD